MDGQLLIQHQNALRARPEGSAVMYQRWRSLLFLHFPCPTEEIQALLPDGLTVDPFPADTGIKMAWVGLVPFRMEGVRPRFLPALPGLSAFPETNVRTYVHREGREPGVWFFSLDAANALACRVARRFFSLPDHYATMSVKDGSDEWRFRSQRRGQNAESQIDAKIGSSLDHARPGSLEFFLVERYLLYTYRHGRLFQGRVHHRPYPLRRVEAVEVSESLVHAAGVMPRPFIHRIASDGVDVEVFPLRPAT